MSYTTTDIEILVATMNRKTPDFLLAMFPFHNLSDLNILIINQTTESNLLQFDIPGIRVINSHDIGLSNSRNLALSTARGRLCVIADDDVVFKEGFDKQIVDCFNEQPDAAVITFRYGRTGLVAADYPAGKLQHTPATIIKVSSIEMVVNREIILQKNITFNTAFGLGAEFQTGEEFLFLRSLIKSGNKVWYYPFEIVSHAAVSSGLDHASDRLVYARAAISYKLYGSWAVLWLFKYLQFLLRKRLIVIPEFRAKLAIGLNGIRRYKSLLKEGKETKDA